MHFLLPSKSRWNGWSYPSKLTYIGTIFGIIGFIFSVFTYLSPNSFIAEVDENVKLYNNKVISFERYDSSLRNILISKELCLRYIVEKKGNKYNYIKKGLNFINSNDLSDNEYRVLSLSNLQDTVIAIGFSEQEEPTALAAIDRLFEDRATLTNIFSKYSKADYDHKKEVIITLIKSLKINNDQKELYLKNIEKINEKALDKLYENLSNFILEFSLSNLSESFKLIRHIINLKKINNDEDAISYIEQKNNSGKYEIDASVRRELFRLRNLESYYKEADKGDGKSCNKMDDDPLDCSVTKSINYNDSSIDIDIRIASSICNKKEGSLNIRFDGEKSCLLKIVNGDYTCAAENLEYISNVALKELDMKKGMNIDTKDQWRAIIPKKDETGSKMSPEQVSRLISILATERVSLMAMEKKHKLCMDSINNSQ